MARIETFTVISYVEHLMKSSGLVLTISLVLSITAPLVAGAITVASPPATALSVTGLLAIVAQAVNWFFTLIVILAVIALLYGAFLFLTAGGDEAKVGTARSWLIWALIGFAVALLARGLLVLVCNVLGVTCPTVF